MKVLVTGGASGLGLSIVSELARSGHSVWFTYCRSKDSAERLVRENQNLRASFCDFGDSRSLEAFCAQVGAEPDLEALVNNALPGLEQKHFQKTQPETWVKSFSATVQPTLQITQAALTPMRKQKRGKICTILTSYLSGRVPIGLSTYVAEKAYLEAMSRSWAVENSAFGIQSNCISPSFLQTGLNAGVDERLIEEMQAKHPLKALLTTDEVAQSVRQLLESSRHLNGVNLHLNGGAHVI